MATIHAAGERPAQGEAQRKRGRDTSRAERTWSVTHARGFLLGVALCVAGFWAPLLIGLYLWSSSR